MIPPGTKARVGDRTGYVQWSAEKLDGKYLVKTNRGTETVRFDELTPLHATTVNPAIERALRANLKEGEQPIPMTVQCISQTGPFQGCYRCGKTDEACRYSALAGIETTEGGLLYECEDCLVLSAADKNLSVADVNNFVESRYLGSCEASFRAMNFPIDSEETSYEWHKDPQQHWVSS